MFSSEQYRALREGAALVNSEESRPFCACLVTERRDYFQCLLTDDVFALTAGTGCYAGLLTTQGRMIVRHARPGTGQAMSSSISRGLYAGAIKRAPRALHLQRGCRGYGRYRLTGTRHLGPQKARQPSRAAVAPTIASTRPDGGDACPSENRSMDLETGDASHPGTARRSRRHGLRFGRWRSSHAAAVDGVRSRLVGVALEA